MREDLPQALDFAQKEEIGTIATISQLTTDRIREHCSTHNKTIENTDLLCDFTLTLLSMTPNLAYL